MIGAAILAAGGGSRFGGGKLLAELRGRPLIEHSIGAFAAVPAIEELVVVLGADAAELRERAELGPAEALVCDGWQEGIAASLRTGVAALAEHGCDCALIGLADQPLISPQVITAVIERSDFGVRPARATFGGAPGHPVALPALLFAKVEELRGDRGARDLLDVSGVRGVEVGHLCSGHDVDTKADLDAIRGRPDGRRETEVRT